MGTCAIRFQLVQGESGVVGAVLPFPDGACFSVYVLSLEVLKKAYNGFGWLCDACWHKWSSRKGWTGLGSDNTLHFTLLNFSCSSSHNPAPTASFAVPPLSDTASASAKYKVTLATDASWP